MKTAPYTYGVDTSGRKYWRSLEEFSDSNEFKEALGREFPEGASELADGTTRRNFLQLMGASLGLAGLSACRRPEEKILPYARPPEQLVPGQSEQYATSVTFGHTSVGLLVESHAGRPTKIDGNPRHPDSLGGTSAFLQATVLDLYDPDRSVSPLEKGADRTWDDAASALRAAGKKAAETQGAGFAILTGAHRSPSLAALLGELQAKWPQAKVYRYDPFSAEAIRAGHLLAFGRKVEALNDVGAAKVIATFDADLFFSEGSPLRHARGFANGRKVEKPGDAMNRLYSAESVFTVTGAMADHRVRSSTRGMADVVAAVARELAALGVVVPAAITQGGGTSEKIAKFAKALAKDLAANKGASLLVGGVRLPAALHGAIAALNVALGNAGTTVKYVRAFSPDSDGPDALANLTQAITGGQVKTLVVLGGNPAFDAPGDVTFGAALAKVEQSFHLSEDRNETSALATWHLNRAHYLESWSDTASLDGTSAITQPLVAPLFFGKTDAEVIDLLLGNGRKAYELTRTYWNTFLSGAAEAAWRRTLHDGVFTGTTYPAETVTLDEAALANAFSALPKAAGGTEIVFQPDVHAWDGRFANNGWMQEMPDQLTKLTWGNAAWVSPSSAAELGLKDGDHVTVSTKGGSVVLPAIIAPGQADGTVAVQVGNGRVTSGRVGTGVGVNTFGLRTTGAPWVSEGSVAKAGTSEKLARTQEHFNMEGRPLVREQNKAEYDKHPDWAKHVVHHPPLLNIVNGYEYNGHKWGMVIDLNACVGCNACMVACQSENNIPVVGKEGVLRSREMHWMRIDRYFEGEVAEPTAVMQPIGCQHCENAPCENVCPVAATNHSPEGLNDMAYNRCVGTRYCANNCPFKVRRFNFFNYNYQVPEIAKMQKNPDVTIRARGVMEKCSYCVQRINQAKIAAHREGRERLRDGEVKSACQESCPTQAIHFGDLNDKDSEVAKWAGKDRGYHLLAELNVRPRTTFLARLRNPNPDLETA